MAKAGRLRLGFRSRFLRQYLATIVFLTTLLATQSATTQIARLGLSIMMEES
jgi:hypothetical protein